MSEDFDLRVCSINLIDDLRVRLAASKRPTAYEKCVCGHVRESHVDTEPWVQRCDGGRKKKCSCECYADKYTVMDDTLDEDEDE